MIVITIFKFYCILHLLKLVLEYLIGLYGDLVIVVVAYDAAPIH